MMVEAGASARRNNNHNGTRRGEIGGQMNWTISLGAGAKGQALCKPEKETRTETEGEAKRKSGEKIGNSGCQEEIVYGKRLVSAIGALRHNAYCGKSHQASFISPFSPHPYPISALPYSAASLAAGHPAGEGREQ